MRWDPTQYTRYADERGQPFVDLGCGPGSLTALLARRWPAAAVEGLDSSPEMIDRAAPLRGTGLRPVFAALPNDDTEEFSVSLAERLRSAYPATPHVTLFPFRRLFVVGRQP